MLIYISVQSSSRFTISEYLSHSSSLVSFKIFLPIKIKTCCHCALLCCNYLPTLRQPIENSVNNKTSFAMAKINLERFSVNLLESIMKPHTQSKNSEIVKFKIDDMLGFSCISWSTQLFFCFHSLLYRADTLHCWSSSWCTFPFPPATFIRLMCK